MEHPMTSPTQRRHDEHDDGSDEEIMKTAPTTSPAQRRHEELVALLTEIRDRLPEPEGVNESILTSERTSAGDPDEALAKALHAKSEMFLGWDDLSASQLDTFRDMARAAREHIEAEGEHAAMALVRQAEADVERLTRERDNLGIRVQKTEADVERLTRQRDDVLGEGLPVLAEKVERLTRERDDVQDLVFGFRARLKAAEAERGAANVRYEALRADVEGRCRNVPRWADPVAILTYILDADDKRGQA